LSGFAQQNRRHDRRPNERVWQWLGHWMSNESTWNMRDA
jgi:hypothetical protein